MKKYLFAIMAVLLALVSCTDSQFLDEYSGNLSELSSSNEINALIEQARWGDGQAFVKLADCYRDGKGVKQDFVGMLTMVAQADEYGGIPSMEDYRGHCRKAPISNSSSMRWKTTRKRTWKKQPLCLNS